jgi:polyhydroxyalkanoic acid synthase PhaR subunit
MSVDDLRKSGEMGQNAMEVLPRWMRMLEEAQSNLVSGGTPPADPLQLATRWYNATSGPFSDFVGDLIEREEFLEPSSQFLQSYAGFYKIFKRNSEEYLKNLQLPARSDVTRVAGLVVALEDKVDNIEALLEDLGDAATATAAIEAPDNASAASVKALEKRLDGIESKLDRFDDIEGKLERLDDVESKLDRLLAVLEANAQSGSAAQAESAKAFEDRLGGVESKLDRFDSVEGKLDQLLTAPENTQNGSTAQATGQPEIPVSTPVSAASSSTAEVEATDAARRKARETGIDLSTVEGTGPEGKITVEDVRKKGDS